MTLYDGERVLEDDYPVYFGYAYIGDGRVIFSMLEGTVADLKLDAGVVEVRSCNRSERGML